MRDIYTLTPNELRELWSKVMPDTEKGFGSSSRCYSYEEKDDTPKRVVAMSGCTRLGVYFGDKPKVWADCDMVSIELDNDKIHSFFSEKNISY